MAKEITVKAEDKGGILIAEFQLQIPETFEDLATIPGKEKSVAYVVNQMKIAARAGYKTHGTTSVFPRGVQKAVKDALEGEDISIDDLMEFIKSRRGK